MFGSLLGALPATGVDVGVLITDVITFLGAIVAVAVGGYAAFVAIRKALSWVRTALG